MLRSLLTTFVLAALHGASLVSAQNAGPAGCVSFDIQWNLLAFGFNGKDYNAGTQDTWASGAATDITTTGRPPFDHLNTTCYLSQFTNAIYFINADKANPSAIYIYDATAKSWSMQQVVQGGFDPSDFDAILDHDTNVFYSYSGGEMYSLDMALLKSANSTAIPWVDVQEPDLSIDSTDPATVKVPGANTDGYKPVLALAQNHVHFIGVPGIPSGSAKIFVIHFSYMQPAPQSYGANAFPTSHGRAASFFLDQGVQQEFAFIPDDGSATYVVSVETNTTKTLTGPPQQDPWASYSASTSALVQLTTAGEVAFLPYDPKTTVNGGTWTKVSKLPAAAFSSSQGTATSSGNGPRATEGSSGNSTNGSNNQTGGANTLELGMALLTGSALSMIGLFAL
ncbi:unnamed protein product [Cyclocybe aegerita]|uniref:Uncharacterized protein n=1 Tax=Cyclocybe aegerita TaxID=1973307 RepID=A0A8S0VYH9_CYCAE|nr:unnamed protein product [Cyclocybe aegerita]